MNHFIMPQNFNMDSLLAYPTEELLYQDIQLSEATIRLFNFKFSLIIYEKVLFNVCQLLMAT